MKPGADGITVKSDCGRILLHIVPVHHKFLTRTEQKYKQWWRVLCPNGTWDTCKAAYADHVLSLPLPVQVAPAARPVAATMAAHLL